ncbi:hypothetical protein CDL15_Pgr024903 [Punica granatum]|uniref:Clp R domain-containing protein n=1 Tax=Punica granatum TaxID=22663 RepID=A0A218W7V7_PUNGR|nr:hypothetical protein CDL15_Pgr024903 [Punica granatum]
MPTPVSVARQCLTEEAARALDDAVAVARRRNHAQTNSLHAISALLSLPSSPLREACTRARSSAYSPRLQFKALELSVGVSLDRLPCSKNLDEPPVSNSLMAAIKRSQANQKRSPDSFHLHQIHSSQQTTASAVKVELKHFLLSILDDPIVSRVFGEAGFRSYDIKLAIVHPPAPQASRLFKSSCPPPVFLCNLMDSEQGRWGSGFPFAGSEDGDDNCRRIGEVLARKSGRNPLIIGVCSKGAVERFLDGVNSGKQGILPAGLVRLSSIPIESEISEFVSGEGGKGMAEAKMAQKFNEVGDALDRCSGSGVIVYFGQLTALIHDDSSSPPPLQQEQEAAAGYVVSELTELLKAHRQKLWLIGTADDYETFLKFVSRFPAAEKDWGLHLLPITYRSSASMQGFSPTKTSLMGSFVPFGGFFPTPSDFANPVSSPCSASRCDLCNKKCAEEVAALMRAGSSTSVYDQYSTNFPCSLQIAEADANKRMNVLMTKDDRTTLNAKILELQKKWNNVCHRLHKPQSVQQPGNQQARSQVVASDSFRLVADERERSSSGSFLPENRSLQLGASTANDLHMISLMEQDGGSQLASQVEHPYMQKACNTQHSGIQSPWSSQKLSTDYRLPADLASPPSTPSVTTDLGLGMINMSSGGTLENRRLQGNMGCPQQLLGSNSSSELGARLKTSLEVAQQSSLSRYNHLEMQPNPHDFKTLLTALQKKVGWQDEALCIIGEVVSRYRSGSFRGSRFGRDLWLIFLGPDRVGKRRIASALAEIIFNDRKRLIYADLRSQEGISPTYSTFELQEFQACEMKLRGRTIIDFIADELRQKPHSVVYLENIDRADVLVQNSLSQAIRTGKLKDTYGREISTSNTIFVATSTVTVDKEVFASDMKPGNYSEERVLRASRWQMQISVECATESASARRSGGLAVVVTSEKAASAIKRKRRDISDSCEQDRAMGIWKQGDKMQKSFLDLNLPVEDVEEDLEDGDSEAGPDAEESEVWLRDFLEQVDEKVVFKPYNFNEAAERVLEEMKLNMQSAVGPEVLMEIDDEVIVQIVAAGWLCGEEEAIKEWIRGVLRGGCVEACRRYKLAAHSILKLTACEGVVAEKQAPGVCLPASIKVK